MACTVFSGVRKWGRLKQQSIQFQKGVAFRVKLGNNFLYYALQSTELN